MSVCFCSLAGTSACKSCVNNPFCDSQPPVRTYTVSATDLVLITGQKTNADRIRSMTDEELADEILRWFNWLNAVEWDDNRILKWLKQESGE